MLRYAILYTYLEKVSKLEKRFFGKKERDSFCRGKSGGFLEGKESKERRYYAVFCTRFEAYVRDRFSNGEYFHTFLVWSSLMNESIPGLFFSFLFL